LSPNLKHSLAKTAESNLGNTLDSFVEDFESLHELTETLKFQHNELEQLIMNEKVMTIAI